MVPFNHPTKNASFQFAILAASVAMTGASSEMIYNIRAAQAVNTAKVTNAKDFILSFSEEGGSKTLPTFLLDIFETPTDLNPAALMKVGNALNAFLLPEVNMFFAYNEVVEIITDIVDMEIIPIDGGSGRRLADRQGTAMEIELTLTFDHEPSPQSDHVTEVVKLVMQDLSELVTNITAYNFPQLNLVDEAHRREHPTPPPTPAPVDNPDGVQTDPEPDGLNSPTARNNQSALQIVPMIVAGASLVALGAFFVFRRKRQSSVTSPKGDMLYVDVEGDLYSMDPSLESGPGHHLQSPPSMDSPSIESSVQSSLIYNGSSVSSRATSPMADDSVFSGLESPRHSTSIRASKSLLSGFTNASSATIQASNAKGKSKDKSNRLLNTPSNMGNPGSLLSAFAEEGDEEYYDEERQGRDPPRLAGTEDSEDSRENPANDAVSPPSVSPNLAETAIVQNNSGNIWGPCDKWYSSNNAAEAQATTPKDVLADLADFASSREASPRDPTPTGRRGSKSRESTPRGNSEKKDQLMIPSPSFAGSMYANLMGCTPTAAYTEKPYPQKASSPLTVDTDPEETPVMRDTNLSSAKASSSPSVRSPLAQALRKQRSFNGRTDQNASSQRARSRSMGQGSIDSTTETPLKRNFASPKDPNPPITGPLGSTKSEKSSGSAPLIKLEWDDNVQAPGTVGAMSAKATRIVSGVFGGDGPLSLAGTAPSRSQASMAEESKPTTPKSSTPRGNVGPLESAPAGVYDKRLGRPPSPGGDAENAVTEADYGASQYCMSPYSAMFGRSKTKTEQTNEDPPTDEDETGGGGYPSNAHKRRHAGNAMGQDGSAMYQASAMHPLDWSYKSADIASVGDSTISEVDGSAIPRHFAYDGAHAKSQLNAKSPASHTSTLSESAKTKDTRGTHASSQHSANQHLISDLVWLEKKIAKDRGGVNDPYASALTRGDGPPAIDTIDSLSYQSNDNDGFVSPSSNEDSGEEPSILTGVNNSVMSSIVCQDVYAPPGKLHIVIHSTKDGPAVHTVKQGSSLEGHLFSGDLIIAVDNVDTRGYTAEQVMKMMASRSSFDRKITVLHFEEDEE